MQGPHSLEISRFFYAVFLRIAVIVRDVRGRELKLPHFCVCAGYEFAGRAEATAPPWDAAASQAAFSMHEQRGWEPRAGRGPAPHASFLLSSFAVAAR